MGYRAKGYSLLELLLVSAMLFLVISLCLKLYLSYDRIRRNVGNI